MTTVDKIAYAILKSIETKHLEEGQILPTERDLAKKYAVNRSTIREALKMLETFRYVKKTSGIGTKVMPNNEWSFESLIFKYQFANRIEPSTAPAFVNFLISVEQSCANVAFNKKLQRDVTYLETLYSELLVSSDPSNQDKDIHMYIAKLSGNFVCERVLNSLWIPIKKYSFIYHTSERKSYAQKLLKDLLISFKHNRKKLFIAISVYYNDALSSLIKNLSASD
jgi:DNA-binding FadR family transcriptional regulator